MTLNGVILCYFTDFSTFGVNYVKVVEARLTLFATEIYTIVKNLVFGNI